MYSSIKKKSYKPAHTHKHPHTFQYHDHSQSTNGSDENHILHVLERVNLELYITMVSLTRTGVLYPRLQDFHHSRLLNGSDHGIEMCVGACVCVRVYKTFF